MKLLVLLVLLASCVKIDLTIDLTAGDKLERPDVSVEQSDEDDVPMTENTL